MLRVKWLSGIVFLMVLGVIVSGCVVPYPIYKDVLEKKEALIKKLDEQNKSLQKALTKTEADYVALDAKYKLAMIDNEALRKQIRINEEVLKKLEQDIVIELTKIPGVTPVPGRRDIVQIQGEILFDPGKAELKESGKEILAQIAKVFKQYPDVIVRIEGHTDNDPIVESKDRWVTGSNFELGAYRALTVLLYLEEQGVDPARMYLASFGEYRPQAANDTPENKAKNRRVVIGFERIDQALEEKVQEEKIPEGKPEEKKLPKEEQVPTK